MYIHILTCIDSVYANVKHKFACPDYSNLFDPICCVLIIDLTVLWPKKNMFTFKNIKLTKEVAELSSLVRSHHTHHSFRPPELLSVASESNALCMWCIFVDKCPATLADSALTSESMFNTLVKCKPSLSSRDFIWVANRLFMFAWVAWIFRTKFTNADVERFFTSSDFKSSAFSSDCVPATFLHAYWFVSNSL